MDPFTCVHGIAAPLREANIDTDVIMPKQFLKGITRDGLSRGLFHDLRFDESGKERSQFILNRPEYRGAMILVVGPNFGCGSSREHAVWGLLQYGIRSLIGSGFASIFLDNCFRNGLLPIALSLSEVEQIMNLCSNPTRSRLTVDLVSETIALNDARRIGFRVDPLRRHELLNGRDAIASTLQYSTELHAFEDAYWTAHPWLRP